MGLLNGFKLISFGFLTMGLGLSLNPHWVKTKFKQLVVSNFIEKELIKGR